MGESGSSGRVCDERWPIGSFARIRVADGELTMASCSCSVVDGSQACTMHAVRMHLHVFSVYPDMCLNSLASAARGGTRGKILRNAGRVDTNLPIAAATGGDAVKCIPAAAAPKHRMFDEDTYSAAGPSFPA